MKTLRVVCAISCFFAFGAAAGPASAKSKPNLKVSAFSVPSGIAQSGAQILSTATVANRGKASASASRTRFYVSLDRKKSKNDTELFDEQKVAKLKKGKSKRAATSVTIFPNIIGIYFVGACADGRNAVKESSETDNCRFSKFSILFVPPPDVVVMPPPPAPDADGDGVPDETDCRPNDAKLPPVGRKTATACESAIRDIAENGTNGAAVAVEHALVTAQGPDEHIYIQVDDVAFGGDAEYSGVEVDAGSEAADVEVGEYVDVIGVLSTPSAGPLVTADSVTGVGTPGSVVFTAVTAGEFEDLPHLYDAVPIKIVGSAITDITDGSWGMSTEYTVAPTLIGSLPLSALVGDSADVSGIGDYDGSQGVLLPRNSSDITIPVRMVSFTSHGGCVTVGSMGAVAMITLNHAMVTDFFIPVNSNDSESLTILGGGVTMLAGNTTASVLAEGVSAGNFGLTAQFGVQQFTTNTSVCPDVG